MKNRKFLATFSLSLVVAASTVFCSIPVQAAEITMAKSAAAVTYGQASSAEIAILKGLFDYEYYKQMNPDVVAKFGDSKDALFNHFVKCGLYEGRSLSANFNVSAYASAYSDLKGKFGSDIIKYYIHYAAVGSKENRPITTLAAAANAGITVTSVADPSVVLTPAAIKAAEAKGITDPAAAMAAAPKASSSGSSSSSGGSSSTKQNATKTEDKTDKTKTDTEAANSFKTTHATILAKTADTESTGITLSDESALAAAETAYAALTDGAKAKLTAEKSKLDALRAYMNGLQDAADEAAADSFKTTYSAILAKTADDDATTGLVVGDETALAAAEDAYDALSAGAQGKLTAEKAKIDVLREYMTDLVDAVDEEAAEEFKTNHAAILAKTADDDATTGLVAGDETALAAAESAYSTLSTGAQGKLTAEKTKIDALREYMTELNDTAAAEEFTTDHAAILAKTADDDATTGLVIGDEAALAAAEDAYDELSAGAQGKLTAEKAKIDALREYMTDLVDAVDEEAAEEFKTNHAAILAKTADDDATTGLVAGDETALAAAESAYSTLSTGAQGKLTAEKAKIDALREYMTDLVDAVDEEAAEEFKTDHAAILAKTADDDATTGLVASDETALAAAESAYSTLSTGAQGKLTTEKAKIDALRAYMTEITS